MEFLKRPGSPLNVLAVLRGRRPLALAGVAIVLALVFIFSHLVLGMSWDDVQQTVPLMSRPQPCPVCPESNVAPRRAGRLHYMIPASGPNKHLCRAMLSSTVNRYGAPILAGWQAKGDLDASETHLAKVRVITTYLDNLPAESDDDLFLMIDGYDVQMQLGADVVIERYFRAAAMEDERIIQQLGPSLAEEVAGPLGRHILFGADKVCWPDGMERAACWAVPHVPKMDGLMFGPDTDKGDMAYSRPRWLNSGTIMGPIREVRDLFHATLDAINATYDAKYEWADSDQYYMAQLWGLQEIERINAQLAEDPEAKHPTGPSDAEWPELRPDRSYNLHIAMDYWSLLFQTWAGYTNFVDWRRFDGPGFGRTIDQNVRGDDNFKPWDMHVDGDALRAVDRIYRTTDDPSMGPSSSALIRDSDWGTNVVTRTTLPVYHCTGAKGALDEFWPRMWFYKHTKALVRSAVQWFRSNEPFAPEPVDSRLWYPAKNYPEGVDLNDGGAWSDGSDASGEPQWLNFNSVCGVYRGFLFGD